MSIRILEGFSAARSHIQRLRDPRGAALPESVAVRLNEIFGRDLSAEEAAAQIVADVRREGDAALHDYAVRIDGLPLETFSASAGMLEAAYLAQPAELRDALHLAAGRIRAFHEREPHQSWLDWDEEGGALGQVVRPLQSVGVYVPGGTAAYPTSLLMAVIPAQVAGVDQITVTTPAGAEGAGSGVILAAAYVAGLERVYLLGGAPAIAALAYGTESVPRVDKICLLYTSDAADDN